MRRPRGVRTVLGSVARLDVPADVQVGVVVVDNDPDRSAEPVVDDASRELGMPIRYVHEPRRGIPFARNTAVEQSGAVDFIAFLDDDEEAEPDWLVELLRVRDRYDADVVNSPVVPRFPEGFPEWLASGGFYDPPRRETGTLIPSATSGSVLFKREVFDHGPFAEWAALSGGSDTHFFTRARLAGRRLVWADEAIVHETVPLTRATPRWLLAREFRRGTTLSHCLRDLEDSRRRRVLRVGRAGLHVLEGLGLLGRALRNGRVDLLRAGRRFVLAAGILAGLAGYRHEEYRTLHGE
jgi:succinoglycan biosynthesis protein ExoM